MDAVDVGFALFDAVAVEQGAGAVSAHEPSGPVVLGAVAQEEGGHALHVSHRAVEDELHLYVLSRLVGVAVQGR